MEKQFCKYWKKPLNEDWYKEKITDKAVEWAEDFGKHLAKKNDIAYKDEECKFKKIKSNNKEKIRPELTTSQLRKFFGELKRIQARGFESAQEDFKLLKPKLAYAVARSKDEDAKILDFYKVFSPHFEKVEDNVQFSNFVKIMEAVVAYHKTVEELNSQNF